MASISDLPFELLLFITRFSDYEYDICALSQTNRRLYFLLSPEVYRRLRETQNPALEWSAINGKKDCVDRLLEAGVPPDMNHTQVVEPILLASFYGHTDVVKSFIQNGVDPNQMTFVARRYPELPPIRSRCNTLGAACIKGHEQVVRMLIDHGVESQPSSNPNDTNQPLCLATKDGNQSIMKILLDHGADPTIKDLDGFNALEYAASLDLEFTLLLVGHVSVNNLANYILERGPIRLALRAGNLPVLKFWLDLTFNWKELDQMLILLLASFADELEFLRGQPATQLFISHIDVDSLLQYFLSSESEAHSSSWGYSLIKLARGIPTLARRLLENNLLDSEMKKDLFYEAAEHGRVDFMNLLTAHGVNGEEYHKKPIGLSCLSWMSPGKPGTKAFAKWLVETDTGPYEIHSDHALRALFCLGDMAILRKYLDTWNVPEETKLRGISNSIYLSIHRESSAIFDFCLESGVKLNPRNPSHDTAFQESVRAGAMPVIKRFLDAGFDVNGDYQSTCMSYLVYTGEYPDYSVLYEAFSEDDIEVSIKTVTFLLEHGADLEKKLTHKYFNFNDAVAKKKQRTCLLRLIKKSHEEARNAMICRGVKFLLEQGADPFSRTTAGETALVLAVKQDFLSVTKVILEFFDETGMSFDKIKKMIRGSVACGLNMPGKKYNETTRFLYRYYWRRVHAVPT